ncbi:MAG: hypothetical protein IKI50_07555 [Clostridia bacterium]|nr:hypothetical protein [Clostridia bacterium]
MKDRPGKKELLCFCAVAAAMAVMALALQGHTVLRTILMGAAVLLPFRWIELAADRAARKPSGTGRA